MPTSILCHLHNGMNTSMTSNKMNTMREILTNWSVGGRRLSNPLVILFRLTVYMPIRIMGILIYIMLLIGWGKYYADNMWNNLE